MLTPHRQNGNCCIKGESPSPFCFVFVSFSKNQGPPHCSWVLQKNSNNDKIREYRPKEFCTLISWQCYIRQMFCTFCKHGWEENGFCRFAYVASLTIRILPYPCLQAKMAHVWKVCGHVTASRGWSGLRPCWAGIASLRSQWHAQILHMSRQNNGVLFCIMLI
jgi:hypothetical protein